MKFMIKPGALNIGDTIIIACRRCYIEYGDGGACGNAARYEARLSWTAGLMLLCEAHAQGEREHGDVIEIRSLRTPSVVAVDPAGPL